MELKEAKYILAIAKNKSISKAAEKLFISQPSLSRYLKNIENQLGTKLFTRMDNQYTPTYTGERYVHYAEKIMKYSNEWSNEYQDIIQQGHGRINLAIPIMRGVCIIQPTLPGFYQIYPNVTINIKEYVDFVAEYMLADYTMDMAIYNVHELPAGLNYEIIGTEEIVMIVSKENPLSRLGVSKEGFRYPWVDLSAFAGEKFILLYPEQTTGSISMKLFKEYGIIPNVLTHTRNSLMSLNLALENVGIAFAPESYYRSVANDTRSVCFSVGTVPTKTTLIAAYHKTRYLPQYMRAYLTIIADYFHSLMGPAGEG